MSNQNKKYIKKYSLLMEAIKFVFFLDIFYQILNVNYVL